MTQNKAGRTNKIDFLQLPWAQEAERGECHLAELAVAEAERKES